MKLNKILFSLMAAFSLLAVSCQEEMEPAYVDAPADLEGCYGVYFPTQEAAGSHTMDPSESPVVEFIVKRTVKEGDEVPAITVPLDVTASEEGIFTIPELSFEEGQEETTLKVVFDKAKPGVEYTLSLVISDPEYAYVYGTNPTFINYSVIIEKYELLGMATIREDLITGYQQNPTGIEWEVEVYQKETTPGWYYLKDAYISAPFNQGWESNKGWDMMPSGSYLSINAENPARVYMPFQNLGCNWSYGWMYAGSIAPEAGISSSSSFYGTLVDGVISFPANGMAFGETEYNNFELSVTNSSGLFRICLPGAILTDYSVGIESGFTNNGQHPVEFTFGADIETIKFLAYEGALSSDELNEKVGEVMTSNDAYVIEKPAADEDGNIPPVVAALSFEKTGVYTVVAVGYDKDNTAQNAAYTNLNYVAADSPVPVTINAGLIVSDKYTPSGYTSENSLEFYIYGQDITTAGFGLFRTADWEANMGASLNSVMTKGLITQAGLDLLNGEGLSDIYVNLMAGTDYTLVVYASNGYEQTYVTARAKTEGVADPLQNIYTMNDLYTVESKEDYYGEWGYYLSDPEYGNERFDMGTPVTVSDGGSETDPETGDVYEYVSVKGLFEPAVAQGIIESDETIFEYYIGALVSLGNVYGACPVDLLGDGSTQYAAMLSFFNAGVGGIVGGAVIGAYTEFGDIAFVDFGQYGAYGGFAYFALGVFADSGYEEYIDYLMAINNILLVDPENMPSEEEAAMQSTQLKLLDAKNDFNKNYNFVEPESVQIKRAIEKMNRKGDYKRAGLNIQSANPMATFDATVMVGETRQFKASNERVATTPLRK